MRALSKALFSELSGEPSTNVIPIFVQKLCEFFLPLKYYNQSQFHSAAKHHVSAPQLLGKPVVGSLRKTHLWDIDKKLIKRFFDSY